MRDLKAKMIKDAKLEVLGNFIRVASFNRL